MADINLDIKITYIDKTPKESFKDKTKLLSKFPKNGLKILRLIRDEKDVSPQDIMEKMQISKEEMSDILSFMEQNNMVHVLQLKSPNPINTDESKTQEPESDLKEFEQVVKSNESNEDNIEPLTIDSSELDEEVDIELPESDKKIDQDASDLTDVSSDVEELEEIKQAEATEQQVSEPNESEDEIELDIDLDLDENNENIDNEFNDFDNNQSNDLDVETEETELRLDEEDEIETSEMEEEKTSKMIDELENQDNQKEDPTNSMSDTEKKVFKKYGEIGLKVLGLIDGKRTIAKIAKEAGISEAMVSDVLNYMKEVGMIKYQNENKQSQSNQTQTTEEKTEMLAPKFEPLTEKKIDNSLILEKPVEIENELHIPIDLPRKKKKSPMELFIIKGKLALYNKKYAKKLYDLIDGKKNFIDLALEMDLSLEKIDEFMIYFSNEKLVEFRQVTRPEIEKRYGKEGLNLYKRFGRDGVFISELIFKKNLEIQDVIKKVGGNPKRIIKIYKFIKDSYGLSMNINEEELQEYLGYTDD